MQKAFQQKPHYDILDGLRGVAALIVILYHVFECFDWSPAPRGYLAVDFFFVLSGFVIGYAYDDRWGCGLKPGGFFRRRLIRLHPMVVLGALLGAVCFLLQGCRMWDGTPVATGLVMLALLLNMLMLPLPVGVAADVRGNGEMFPLNGPNWSLFFEYIGNVLYALLLRRMPTRWLCAVAVVTGGLLGYVTLSDGYLGVGWSVADGGFWSGLVRMLFPYTVGMLMARRIGKCPAHKGDGFTQGGIFTDASLVLVLAAVVPLFFGELPLWAGGLYDVLCVALVFPAVVWHTARLCPVHEGIRADSGRRGTRIIRFLGDLSYPLYAVHYPLMYLFYAHIGFTGELVPIAKVHDVWPVALALPIGCILLAWLSLHYYDLPVRRWLTRTWK
ncbi:MAG: acyltransferase [Alloprevotella sp.]|nr:acyltransferase [Alloprevotella sp.]